MRTLIFTLLSVILIGCSGTIGSPDPCDGVTMDSSRWTPCMTGKNGNPNGDS